MGYARAFHYAAALALTWNSAADARLTTGAKVRYETESGQSSWRQTDVSFLTGAELNSLTSSGRYQALRNYAVIFFQSGEAAVIRIDHPSLICSFEFQASCLPVIGNMKGSDQADRAWEICTSILC